MDRASRLCQHVHMSTCDTLWRRLLASYKSDNPEEAERLLLHNQREMLLQPPINGEELACIRWLISNRLITIPEDNESGWPGLQEIQLQCNALKESERPDCILHGKLHHSGTETHDE